MEKGYLELISPWLRCVIHGIVFWYLIITHPLQLSIYLSAILSLLMATLLGFIDDVFDVRWRHKLPIPLVAAIPLLLVYWAEGGNTHIVVPKPARFILGTIVDLGIKSDLSILSPPHYLSRPVILFLHVTSINILHK